MISRKAKTVLSDGTEIKDLFNMQTNEVSLSALYDSDLYEIEMEEIFRKKWLMVGHETEIPKSGDFVVRDMAEDEVIVTRDREGTVHVNLNVCPHRGMHICLTESGNAQTHQCIYHGWAFRPDGRFIGAPMEKEKMHGDVYEKSELGLKKAKVEIYHGLIFANWDHNAAPLDEQLGELKFYYDIMFGKTSAGMEVLGPVQRLMINANWKTAGEQSACDGFHVLTLHRSQIELGNFGGEGNEADDNAPAMYGVNVADNGNALRCISADSTFRGILDAKEFDNLSNEERLKKMPPPGIYTDEQFEDMKKTLTEEQLYVAAVAPPQVGGMFPNLNLLFVYAPLPDGTLGSGYLIHAINPKGVGKFQWVTWFLCEKGTPEEVKKIIRQVAVQTGGTSGLIEQDDTDTWPHMTEAAKGSMGKTITMKYQALSGVQHPEGWPKKGKVYEGFSKDDAQWSWWQHYYKLMVK